MGKNLKDMTRQEQAAYFKSKDYRGEQLKIVMDAISYGIGADYLQLFEDTSIPIGIMENMFTAMKEDHGVELVKFLSSIGQEESGRIFLEALRAGVSFQELKESYRDGMLPIELREKILPLMQGRAAVPEEIGERMEFITEAVRELRESFSRQDSFLEELKKAMKEKPDILSAQGKGEETDRDTDIVDDPCYLELEAQFRQAREDAERLLEEREETGRRLRELETENKSLYEQLTMQKLLVAGLQGEKNAQESRKIDISKKTNSSPLFRFPLARKKPGLLERLAGELDAGQIAEIRLGIGDGLNEEQLILLADKSMDAEKIRELRMTMKILNERGQGS